MQWCKPYILHALDIFICAKFVAQEAVGDEGVTVGGGVYLKGYYAIYGY